MIKAEILDILCKITEEEQRVLDGKKEVDWGIYNERGVSIVSGKKMLDAGKLIAVRPHTRFAYFPQHTHDYIELIYMCSGSTQHIIDGDRIELQEGGEWRFGL